MIRKVRIEEEANEAIDIRTEGRGRPVKKQKEKQLHGLSEGALPEGRPMTKIQGEQEVRIKRHKIKVI